MSLPREKMVGTSTVSVGEILTTIHLCLEKKGIHLCLETLLRNFFFLMFGVLRRHNPNLFADFITWTQAIRGLRQPRSFPPPCDDPIRRVTVSLFSDSKFVTIELLGGKSGFFFWSCCKSIFPTCFEDYVVVKNTPSSTFSRVAALQADHNLNDKIENRTIPRMCDPVAHGSSAFAGVRPDKLRSL